MSAKKRPNLALYACLLCFVIHLLGNGYLYYQQQQTIETLQLQMNAMQHQPALITPLKHPHNPRSILHLALLNIQHEDDDLAWQHLNALLGWLDGQQKHTPTLQPISQALQSCKTSHTPIPWGARLSDLQAQLNKQPPPQQTPKHPWHHWRHWLSIKTVRIIPPHHQPQLDALYQATLGHDRLAWQDAMQALAATLEKNPDQSLLAFVHKWHKPAQPTLQPCLERLIAQEFFDA